MSERSKRGESTESVHGGDVRLKPHDAIPMPIIQTATYEFESTDEVERLADGTHEREREEYGRYGNPTCRALEHRLAALEGTEDALVFASGMAAITTAVLAFVKSGHHVVAF